MNDKPPIARLQQLSELLRLELENEQKSYSNTLVSNQFSNHITEAGCRYPVTLADSSYNTLDQLTLTLRYDTDEELTDSDFEPGKPVSLFYRSSDGSTVHEHPHQYFIAQTGVGFLTLILPNPAALSNLRMLADSHLIGVRLCVDTTSYRVMQGALNDVARTDNPRLVNLRNIFLNGATPHFRKLPRISLPWLNTSQQDAVQKVIESEEVAIVHGPPGTGKTTTLVEAIIEALRRETQVLVCAPSNTAVDWISEQLSRRGINVLRIGNPIRISDEMLDCSYERRFAAHPLYSDLWAIRRELHNNHNNHKNGPNVRTLRERATSLEIRINADLFQQASVISCTLIGSAYQILEHRHFSTLFIDEAAQALEPACWVALRKCDRVVMSGDHQQLPPTVKSPEAARGGLGVTLMQRIVQQHPACVVQLNVQYRMHRDIMEFSSRHFYHGRLTAAPDVAHRLVTPLDTPLMWVDTAQCGFGEKQSRSLSHSNADEARLLIRILREYIEFITPARVLDQNLDFGIISPYRAQVRLIRRLLRLQRFFRQFQSRITVHTVDGFQGQERDVIIISMVRDNDQGTIGFLRDLRRMNVALTRARMKLIVLGNAETLSRHPFYASLIDHFRDRGDYLLLPHPSEEG